MTTAPSEQEGVVLRCASAAPEGQKPADAAEDIDGAAAALLAKQARARLLAARNTKAAKKARFTGAASGRGRVVSGGEGNGGDEVGASDGVGAGDGFNFSEAMVVVINDLLPEAKTLWAPVEQGWRKDRKGYIMDIPAGLEYDEDWDKAGRWMYKPPKDSLTCSLLDERLAGILKVLDVVRTARVGLLAQAGCTRQAGHFDYSPVTVQRWHAERRAARKRQSSPWTLLLSLQDGGILRVWAGGKWINVELNAGEACLFRSDVWHGGATYAAPHWRLHEYWEPNGAKDGGWNFRMDVAAKALALHAMEGQATWKPTFMANVGAVYRGPRYSLAEVEERLRRDVMWGQREGV